MRVDLDKAQKQLHVLQEESLASHGTINEQRFKLETMARQISQPSPELLTLREQLVDAHAESREMRRQQGQLGDKVVSSLCQHAG